jgi:hypothetical protein
MSVEVLQDNMATIIPTSCTAQQVPLRRSRTGFRRLKRY